MVSILNGFLFVTIFYIVMPQSSKTNPLLVLCLVALLMVFNTITNNKMNRWKKIKSGLKRIKNEQKCIEKK